jgi:hypothetical protein
MTLSPLQFVAVIETFNDELAKLTEEEEMNILINLIKLAVDRRKAYPLYIIDAIIDVLDARLLMGSHLAPGSKRTDN